jgi:hypothetical protein
MKRIMMLASLVLLASGCYRTTIKTSAPRAMRDESEVGASFVYGLTGVTTNASECKYGVAEASVFHPWYSVLVSGITFGLVAPMQAEYTCVDPKGFASMQE